MTSLPELRRPRPALAGFLSVPVALLAQVLAAGVAQAQGQPQLPPAAGTAPAGAASAAADEAGRVVFVSGPAQLVAADGSRRAAVAGQAVRPGEQVITGADAYVHLRMVDNAFVAVRPESRLGIELYDYQADKPAASRIKLTLQGGNARTVSGKGGEAAKQNYRFNTPVAAIGLRGTDYTVTAAADATRVSVARGAVTVSPFGDGCSAAGLGPCSTPSARELTARLSHAYLEINAAGRIPVLVRPEQDPQGGRQQNPASKPEEPHADTKPAVDKASDKTADKSSDKAPSTLNLPPGKEVAGQMAVEKLSAALPVRRVELVWGRWTSAAATPGSLPALNVISTGREVMVGNNHFGLFRANGSDFSMPSQGAFSFSMAGSEAYAREGGTLTAAQVTAGTFSLDFTQRTFDTTLAVQHAGGVESLQARGTVQFQGRMASNAAQSNMTVNGALAAAGTEAAYLFEKPLASGGLLGAVRWVR